MTIKIQKYFLDFILYKLFARISIAIDFILIDNAFRDGTLSENFLIKI